MIIDARRHFRATMAARQLAHDPSALKWVEGPPSFRRSNKGGLLGLTVDGKYFSLIELRGRTSSADAFTWGSNTPYLGVLRAWYPPNSELLLRAEFRPYTHEEVEKVLQAVIDENKAWKPNLPSILEKYADNPKVMADAERVVETFLKESRDDVAKLEALKPKVLPGTPQKERTSAAEEFNLIVMRIEFTRGAVTTALKTVKNL